MTNEQLTQETMRQGERISKAESDIKTLFGDVKEIRVRSEEHHQMVENIHELALAIHDLTGKVNNVDERLAVIETDKRQKGYAVWKIIVSALIGGVISYFIFGG